MLLSILCLTACVMVQKKCVCTFTGTAITRGDCSCHFPSCRPKNNLDTITAAYLLVSSEQIQLLFLSIYYNSHYCHYMFCVIVIIVIWS